MLLRAVAVVIPRVVGVGRSGTISGHIADKLGHRKSLLLVGYGLTQ